MRYTLDACRTCDIVHAQKECPLCAALWQIKELTDEVNALQRQLDDATADASTI